MSESSALFWKSCYICHARKSNLVEFQILPEESPFGVSTFYQ